MENVSLLAACFAGVLSFVSPCVLPLIPGYLSFVPGVTVDEMRGTGDAGSAGRSRGKVLLSSLAFVLGFSLVFISLGASATAIGGFLMSKLTLFGKIAGVLIVLFGLHMMGVWKISWLYTEKRNHEETRRAVGRRVGRDCVRFGWTPCIDRFWPAFWPSRPAKRR